MGVDRRRFLKLLAAAPAAAMLPLGSETRLPQTGGIVSSVTMTNRVSPGKCLGRLGATRLNEGPRVHIQVVNVNPDDFSQVLRAGAEDQRIIEMIRRRADR